MAAAVPKIVTRLVMSEKPVDGTVAWYQGEIDDGDGFPSEDHMLALPNTVSSLGKYNLHARTLNVLLTLPFIIVCWLLCHVLHV